MYYLCWSRVRTWCHARILGTEDLGPGSKAEGEGVRREHSGEGSGTKEMLDLRALRCGSR
ncbi:hypothetical protein DACRYDRAFT_23099 [Dacryopinax primogenitus]|uniref:Uncharacterized protein n=1 Tax=Dacryopinax primogenitus (strain DJM 731) TaxID=1858805 RepID=M5GA53_DACPD|nr:uncharacterized protein DACRYDRAFT_23099 [Dacryopinax primogenitus]EJU00753.1 hypothetical protein DACRYDRAFT_23099 [Dacryopinax primogenitus]